MSFLTSILAESEPSKTPFYIAGGLLAGWAVAISLIGQRSPEFPNGKGPLRVALAISFVLVAGAMSTAVITS